MSLLLITPGDPLGIGPEVTVKALAAAERGGHPVEAVLVGDRAALAREASRIGFTLGDVVDPGDVGEPVEVASVRWAVAEILAGRGAGLVTGPIHKARLAARGFPHAGHTEFLGALCGVDGPVMAFAGGSLMVALVTVHLPLRRVADALTVARVRHVVATADAALRRDLGLAAPRIAVCGLNPHAGDSGLLGDEEITVIGPAIAACVAEGIDARGPMSAETAFRQAADRRVDLVVAMYHDQGLAPLKLVDFGRSVNWTLGLPIIRTSVDHGTGDDIAGRGLADAASMSAAIAFAGRLVRSATP